MSSVMILYRSKKYQSVNKAYIINKPAQNHNSRRTNHPAKTQFKCCNLLTSSKFQSLLRQGMDRVLKVIICDTQTT